MIPIHIPVLCDEILQFAAPVLIAGTTYIDGTLGEAGHSLAVRRKFPETYMMGFDRDPEMLSRAATRIEAEGFIAALSPPQMEPPAFNLRRIPFTKIAEIVRAEHIAADFILLDLGVSQFHFKGAHRGFSFGDESLDMRLDPDLPETAADFLKRVHEKELKRILSQYGEERYAGRIARAIKEAKTPIRDARRLAELICASVPGGRGGYGSKHKNQSTRIHPATRTFQALRIAVNRELEELAMVLKDLPRILSPGGILAVISFHSLEDRIVKQAFRALGKPLRMPKNGEERLMKRKRERKPELSAEFSILTPKPLRPSPEEIERNPAARSARLRVLGKRSEAI